MAITHLTSKSMRCAFLFALVSGAAAGRAGTIADIDGAPSSTDKLRAAQPVARLANDAYRPVDDAAAAPAGVHMLEKPKLNPAASGFKARTYRQGGEVVVAFAGTEFTTDYASQWEAWVRQGPKVRFESGPAMWLLGWRLTVEPLPVLPGDLLTDFELAVGARPVQLTEASEFVASVKSEYGQDKFLLCGHSLGGSLAMYAGKLHGIDAVTFNGAYLYWQLRGELPREGTSRVVAFEVVDPAAAILRQDPVSLLGRFPFGGMPGLTVVPIPHDGEDFLMHGIKNFLTEPAKGFAWVNVETVATAPPGGPAIPLKRGTGVLRLAPPADSGRVRVAFLAKRRGYASSLYVEKVATPPGDGRVTTPLGTPMNVRADAAATAAKVAQVPRDFVLTVVGQKAGQAPRVTRGTRSSGWSSPRPQSTTERSPTRRQRRWSSRPSRRRVNLITAPLWGLDD